MTSMTRRDALAAGLSSGAVLLGGSPFLAQAARRDLKRGTLLRGGTFEHGVASGMPFTDGATLWTRLTGLERTGRVELQVARDPGFRRVLVRQPALANAVRDFAVKRTVRSPRLKPGERYWYRFVTRDGSSPVGRFKTALPPGSAEPVRIGFFSCQKWHQGWFNGHAGLAAEDDLDLVVSLGDYVYEEPVREGSQLVDERDDRTGDDGDVQSLAEYRQKYRLYQSDADLRAMHAAHPFAAIWDDHEAEDDYAGENEGDPLRPRRVPFLERRRAGYLSFFESLPVPRFRDDPFRIYGGLRIGQAELLLLDTRQHRDALACAPITPCPQGEAAGRSILGQAQKAWLKEALAGSGATWKVIANQVMMMSLDVPAPGVTINADQWDGYAAERRELMEHVLARGVRDVAVLTGDIHTFFAGTVTTTGRVTGAPAATEFVGGSITSTGIHESLRDQGVPGSAGQQAAGLRAINPHITYAELERKGYGVLEARSDELRVTYRSPESVLVRPSPVRDLARFRVARGSTEVEVL